MLLASPVRLPSSPDLDLEFMIPGLAPRLQALGRVVREAPEVEWPYLGYGVEFMFVPPDTQEALSLLVTDSAERAISPGELTHGIHSTLRREDWIYEILEPVRYDSVWHAEIRRSAARAVASGPGGPFYVVEGNSRDGVLLEAREFLARYVRSACYAVRAEPDRRTGALPRLRRFAYRCSGQPRPQPPTGYARREEIPGSAALGLPRPASFAPRPRAARPGGRPDRAPAGVGAAARARRARHAAPASSPCAGRRCARTK
jgi:hypothetical protein